MIEEMFDDLKAEIAKGKDLPFPEAPVVEEEFKKNVIRPMTVNEIGFMAACDHAGKEARKMVARLTLMNRVGLKEESTPERIHEYELVKFHATMLEDLFFWYIQSATGWKYSVLLQRLHEDRLVLVGLNSAEASAYLKKFDAEQELEELINDTPETPRLVN